MRFYWFEFEDGYRCCVAGMSKQELRVEENNDIAKQFYARNNFKKVKDKLLLEVR